MNQNRAAFHYQKDKFPSLSDSLLKEAIFAG